jgi:hypothetical protein
MNCPRCGNKWDVRQNPCPRCNLHSGVFGRQRSANRLVPVKDVISDTTSSALPLNEKSTVFSSTYQLKLTDDKSRCIPLPARLKEVSPLKLPTTEDLRPRNPVLPFASGSYAFKSPQASSQSGLSSVPTQSDLRPLPNGTLLYRERYRLQQVLHEQEWPLAVKEIIWSAFDRRFSDSPVVIYELIVLAEASSEVQSIPYNATKTFTAIGRQPHIPMLRDVFNERGRHFFVFESVRGVPLSVLMERNGGKLSEQEMVACCLQITSLLDMFFQQSIPLMHGNIGPECIVKEFSASHFVLTNFSVVLAGGLARMVANLTDLSPLPEILKGKLDGSDDLYALLVTTYYALTGSRVLTSQSIAMASELSAGFRIILSKGLHLSPEQCYQAPAELHQDLLALSDSFGSISSPSSSGDILPTLVTPEPCEAESVALVGTQTGYTLALPLYEDLHPLKESNDFRNAVLWFIAAIAFIMLFLGRGL